MAIRIQTKDEGEKEFKYWLDVPPEHLTAFASMLKSYIGDEEIKTVEMRVVKTTGRGKDKKTTTVATAAMTVFRFDRKKKKR